MSLLGLMLADVLSRAPVGNGYAHVTEGERVTPLERLTRRVGGGVRGDVVVRAGEMAVTLAFDERGVAIERGAREGARTRVEGSLGALLDVALGDGLLVALLGRRIRLSGNPLTLLGVAALLRTVVR
ncbi:MAG: hypothetical protein KC503_42955 [Myxococcales bacterium]|nr:hypothetical protein [Myxococcales bacterium]